MLVGHVISLRWPSGNWYDCVIKAYNPETGKHFGHYEDDDRVWYNMERQNYVVKGPAPEGWDEGLEELLSRGEKQGGADSSSSSSGEEMGLDIINLAFGGLYVACLGLRA